MINPENKCAQLMTDNVPDISITDMLNMQKKLQDFYAAKGRAVNLDTASFKEKVNDVTVQFRNFSSEFIELINNLPHKEWKTYSPEQLAGFTSEEHKLESQYEVIDMFHFFLNMCLLMDIDGPTFQKLYYTKNKENFDRQARGY